MKNIENKALNKKNESQKKSNKGSYFKNDLFLTSLNCKDYRANFGYINDT
jgi:hypothetical protein